MDRRNFIINSVGQHLAWSQCVSRRKRIANCCGIGNGAGWRYPQAGCKRTAVKDYGRMHQDVEMLRVWGLLIRLLNSVIY